MEATGRYERWTAEAVGRPVYGDGGDLPRDEDAE